MGVIFSLLSAVTYGAADFFGGFATKRSSVFAVMIVSQMFGSLVLLAALPWFMSVDPTGRALSAGALAGVAGAVGVGFFYKGLSIGRMSVVAPITAVLSACFPVVYGLIGGERPSATALVGVALALAAVGLISSSPESPAEPGRVPPSRTGLPHALAAGLGFGLFFIFLARGGEDGGSWALVGSRLGSLATMALWAAVLRRPVRPAPGSLLPIIAAGLLDVTANLFYLLSTRHGLLAVVAVVTSMYPASTVVLARVVLGERLHGRQFWGFAVAVSGVTAIALG